MEPNGEVITKILVLTYADESKRTQNLFDRKEKRVVYQLEHEENGWLGKKDGETTIFKLCPPGAPFFQLSSTSITIYVEFGRPQEPGDQGKPTRQELAKFKWTKTPGITCDGRHGWLRVANLRPSDNGSRRFTVEIEGQPLPMNGQPLPSVKVHKYGLTPVGHQITVILNLSSAEYSFFP